MHNLGACTCGVSRLCDRGALPIGHFVLPKPAMDSIERTDFTYTRPGLGKAGCDSGRCHIHKLFSQCGFLAVSSLQALWAPPGLSCDILALCMQWLEGQDPSSSWPVACHSSPATLQRTPRHLSTWVEVTPFHTEIRYVPLTQPPTQLSSAS